MSRDTDLKTFVAELHIHTVLSPCAAVEMIPPYIVERAVEKGINLIAILGFVTVELPVDALEVFQHTSPAQAREKHPQLRDFALIQNGDAHFLDDLLGANIFQLAAPTIAEIRLAFQKKDGRSLVIRPPTN